MAHKSQFVWGEALPSPAEHLIHSNLTDFPSYLLNQPLVPVWNSHSWPFLSRQTCALQASSPFCFKPSPTLC